ncbi:MAG: hypothetical protein ACI8ZM_004995 [Crocinitomix sp.]|jgi:hypothetical protein
MKFLLFLFAFFACNAYCQYPSGGGNFPEYKNEQIKSITKLQVNYSYSTENDTLFRFKQEFDENGNMIQENFKCIYDSNCYYRYHYNEYGLLFQVDSIGFWGYGRGYGFSNGDTTYLSELKEYRYTDHGQQLEKEVRIDYDRSEKYTSYYEYNSDGNVTKVMTYAESFELDLTHVLVTLYEYNSDGLIMSKASYDANATEVMTERHLTVKQLYEYEKH